MGGSLRENNVLLPHKVAYDEIIQQLDGSSLFYKHPTQRVRATARFDYCREVNHRMGSFDRKIVAQYFPSGTRGWEGGGGGVLTSH